MSEAYSKKDIISSLPEVLKEELQAVSYSKTANGIEIIEINRSEVIITAEFLKNKAGFDILFSVTGTDYHGYIEIMYHFYSTLTNQTIIVKSKLNREVPSIDSISNVYSAANWHERETYDLLGVVFNNHPELERILLPKDWIGHPLRKDYVNQDARLTWNER